MDKDLYKSISDALQQKQEVDSLEKMFEEFSSFLSISMWIEHSFSKPDPIAYRKAAIEKWKFVQIKKLDAFLTEYTVALNSSEIASKAFKKPLPKGIDEIFEDPEDIREHKISLLRKFEEKVLNSFLQPLGGGSGEK